MLEQALRLARRGFYVFPLQPGSKKPLLAGGVHGATRDEAQIGAWWRENPTANIGISPAPSGLMVVDVDPKNDGPDALTILELENSPLPKTMTVRTPSGGHHYYFRTSVPAGTSASKIAKGVDVRAAGGYVVGSGSILVVAGRERWYAELCDLGGIEPEAGTLADAPLWLVQLAGTPRSRTESTQWLAEPDQAHNVTAATKFLKETTEVAVSGHGGNTKTFQTFAIVRDYAVGEDLALELVEKHYNPRCIPPWSHDELATIAANVYQYASEAAGKRAAKTSSLDEMAAQAVAYDEAQKKQGITSNAEAQAAKPSPFRPLTWAQMTSLPAPTWLVDQTLPEHAVAMLYGPWGAYKSFIAVGLCTAIASGGPWMGRTVRQGPAVYAAGEGAYGIVPRFRASAALAALQAVENIFLVPTVPLLGDMEQVQQFHDALKPLKPALIVIDTLARAMAGMDENATKDASLAIKRLDELRASLGCTIVLVHHAGKNEKLGSRGSSVIPASVDTLLAVSSRADTREATLRMEKQKDAERWTEPLGLRGRTMELGEHGTSLAFELAPIQPTMAELTEDRRFEALDRLLKTWPVPGPVKTTELAAAISDAIGTDNATSVRDWLRRTAKKKRPLLVASDEPLEFQHPEREES